MIIKNFNTTDVTPLKTDVADVPQFGKDAQMLVTELSGKCRAYRDRLFKHIESRKSDLSENELDSMYFYAMIVPCIVHPDTRDPLISIDQFEQFVTMCSQNTADALIASYNKTNVTTKNDDDDDGSLASKKKKS